MPFADRSTDIAHTPIAATDSASEEKTGLASSQAIEPVVTVKRWSRSGSRFSLKQFTDCTDIRFEVKESPLEKTLRRALHL